MNIWRLSELWNESKYTDYYFILLLALYVLLEYFKIEGMLAFIPLVMFGLYRIFHRMVLGMEQW